MNLDLPPLTWLRAFEASARTLSFTHAAAELHITTVIQGAPDKRAAFATLAASHGLQADQIAYMGDDLLDLPVLQMVGLSAAPGDACKEVRAHVHYVTQAAGGRGAVREFIELILRGRGRWDALVRGHLVQARHG